MTTKLDEIDGMITRGRASFKPTVRARKGRHTVEKPRPVTPLAVAANR